MIIILEDSVEGCNLAVGLGKGTIQKRGIQGKAHSSCSSGTGANPYEVFL